MPTTTPRAPGSTASLGTANQERVLAALRGGGAHTQAALARQTGLAPATVSNIVRGLAELGLVEVRSGSGRRGSSVRLARSAGLVAGVDFGHRHVSVAIADLTGDLLAQVRRPLAATHAHDSSLALATGLLDDLLADLGQPIARDQLRRIGMAVPAPVAGTVVRSAGILPGWREVDARAAAEEAFGCTVDVANDANLGALAEHRRGRARGTRSSVFVKLSSGVGAGIMVHDELFDGAHGTAGELGHLTLDESGPLCRCGGRGCLETYCSAENVLDLLADHLPAEATIDDAVAAGRSGDVAARRAFEDAGLHLGWGLAGLVNLLDPEVVVMGGDMARAGDLLLDAVRQGLRRHALDAVAQTPVLASELGERASLVGAVLLAAENTQLLDAPRPS
ncbi:ROK family transcriptional regulator [Nocardioides insulae]|uniref:ROK family transcriptional regulator n=1 Tax=Nocardioides insulae TaxID=394734 RepID=UPI00042013EE|nr:ROK family transcriptional regulator [Nocardioides insulae]